MLVLTRFRSTTDDSSDSSSDSALRADLEALGTLFAASVGCRDVRIGRNLDDPGLWVLTTRWESTGAYRRALSTYDFKLRGLPLMVRAVDEPSAYELVEPDSVLNVAEPRVT